MRELTPRERLARYKTLAYRGLAYWRAAALIFFAGASIALIVAIHIQRSYRSECSVVLNTGIRTEEHEESAESRNQRISANLKEILTLRSHLELAIKKFHLYQKTVDAKGMLDAVDEMKPHVGFRTVGGGTYAISFDASEGDGPNTQTLVRDVTQYLADSLIESYANSNLGDLKTNVNFFEQQATQSEDDVERATKAVTVFLSQHPEFAFATQQQAANSPFGAGPGPAAGLPPGFPLIPTAASVRGGRAGQGQEIDPTLLAAYQSDPTLRVLYLRRARLDDEMRASAVAAPAPSPPAVVANSPAASAAVAAIAAQMAPAQAEVEAAQKRVAETQADLLTKSAQLAPEHPDFKAAQSSAAAAASQLATAKAKLTALEQQHRAATAVGTVPASAGDTATGNAEIAARIRLINAQIGAREAEIRSSNAGGGHARAPAKGAPAGDASGAPVAAEPTSPLVALETEWQRLLRDLAGARSTLDTRKRDYEKAKMAVMAAQAASNEVMSVAEPAYRPTHPSKGGRTPAAIVGLTAAALGALLYVGARIAFNDTIIDADDVEALNVIPVLGVVPRLYVGEASARPAGGPAQGSGGASDAV